MNNLILNSFPIYKRLIFYIALNIQNYQITKLYLTLYWLPGSLLMAQLLYCGINIILSYAYRFWRNLNMMVITKFNCRLQRHGYLKYYRVSLSYCNMWPSDSLNFLLFNSFLTSFRKEVIQCISKKASLPYVAFQYLSRCLSFTEARDTLFLNQALVGLVQGLLYLGRLHLNGQKYLAIFCFLPGYFHYSSRRRKCNSASCSSVTGDGASKVKSAAV